MSPKPPSARSATVSAAWRAPRWTARTCGSCTRSPASWSPAGVEQRTAPRRRLGGPGWRRAPAATGAAGAGDLAQCRRHPGGGHDHAQRRPRPGRTRVVRLGDRGIFAGRDRCGGQRRPDVGSAWPAQGDGGGGDHLCRGLPVRGAGGGAGRAMVASAVRFPPRRLAGGFACRGAGWGVGTLLGPRGGGLFAEAGNWRGVFWLFAGQAIVFCAAAPWLLADTAAPRRGGRVPGRQLAVLAAGVGLVALADIARLPWLTVAMVLLGLAVLAGLLRLDARAPVRLLPLGATDPRTAIGAGYGAMFVLMASAMGLTVYAPALLQILHGLSPLWAGYVIAAQAMAWTLAAFAIAGVDGGPAERRCIRTGAALIGVGLLAMMLALPRAPLWAVVSAAAVMGSGFGLSSSLM